ncbi:MAG TPA: hypothetical protein VJI52_06530 [Candidatus Nanoarchaeia archaeon]|nr:hypothetical protein [Candidatus Nanoarchaeia archaeon]
MGELMFEVPNGGDFTEFDINKGHLVDRLSALFRGHGRTQDRGGMQAIMLDFSDPLNPRVYFRQRTPNYSEDSTHLEQTLTRQNFTEFLRLAAGRQPRPITHSDIADSIAEIERTHGRLGAAVAVLHPETRSYELNPAYKLFYRR